MRGVIETAEGRGEKKNPPNCKLNRNAALVAGQYEKKMTAGASR